MGNFATSLLQNYVRFGRYEDTCFHVLPTVHACDMFITNAVRVILEMQCARTVSQDVVCKWLRLVFVMHVVSVIRSGLWPQADYTISGKHSGTVVNYKGSGGFLISSNREALLYYNYIAFTFAMR